MQDAGIPYELMPGTSVAIVTTSVVSAEQNLPKISQTVIITRGSAKVGMQ